jgi:hypothetical protein
VHVAIAHEGSAVSVPALDGLPYIPSVVACAPGRALVGAPARAHLFVSPAEVLFGPARHLGGGQVLLGEEKHEPEELVARLLDQAVAAGLVLARGPIDGVAISRAAWASSEARRALAGAAQRAGLHLVRTEVSTTLGAIARHQERGPAGLVAFVDVGGWKIEATILSVETDVVRALGRSVDATIGANWLDGRLVKALAHQVAPEREAELLRDRLCYALLREQCEAMRIQLSADTTATLPLPFLAPLLRTKEPPVWRLERTFLETLSSPLIDAIQVVCGEALAHAQLQAQLVNEVCVLGGLARMPAVRQAVSGFFGRPAVARGDVEGLVARGAALAAAVSLGQLGLRVIDDLDEHGHAVAAAGWGQPVPPYDTPAPEIIPAPPVSQGGGETRASVPAPSLPAPAPPQATPVAMPPRARMASQEALRTQPYAGATHAPHARSPSQEAPRAQPNAHAPHVRSPSQEAPRAHHLRSPSPEAPRARLRSPSQEALRAPPPSQTSLEPPVPAPPAVAHEVAATEPGPPPPTANAPETMPPTAAPQKPGQELRAEGPLRNPRDPAALAATPFDGPLSLAPPLSVPVLLLAIGRRRSFSGQLSLKRENREACIAVVRGGAAGTSLDMEQLRRSFEWPDGTYRITDEPPPERLLATRRSMVSVVMHGIRSLLRVMDTEQVSAVLAPQLLLAPRVLPGRAALVPLLGLSPRELRFVEHVLDGATTVDEILRRGGIGRDTALHLIFVLHLFRALEWRSVDECAGTSPADQLRARAQKLEKADHFEVLGVHWSVSRVEIDRAWRRIEEEMKPGGRASQIDAQAAERILARARSAYQVVAHAGDRHAYLLTIHPDLDFEAIESVAEDQNQWYAYRGAAEATEESARLKNELLELSRLQHDAPKPRR